MQQIHNLYVYDYDRSMAGREASFTRKEDAGEVFHSLGYEGAGVFAETVFDSVEEYMDFQEEQARIRNRS